MHSSEIRSQINYHSVRMWASFALAFGSLLPAAMTITDMYVDTVVNKLTIHDADLLLTGGEIILGVLAGAYGEYSRYKMNEIQKVIDASEQQ